MEASNPNFHGTVVALIIIVILGFATGIEFIVSP